MSELDFTGLREVVENSTILPEFQNVTRRARKHQRRRRFAAAAKIFGVLAIATPGLVAGGVIVMHVARTPSKVVAELDGDDNGGTAVHGPIKAYPVTRSVVAADGIDMSHVYGLVDVCTGNACNLQLSTLGSGEPSGMTLRLNLLRSNATQSVDNARIVVVNSSTVVVSGTVGATPVRQQVTFTPPAGAFTNTAERVVQPTVKGELQTVRGPEADPVTLIHQPPVSLPVLQSESHGWWVSGTSPDSGELAVSVSRNDGASWATHTLGMLADRPSGTRVSGPALATSNGVDVYVLVASGDQMALVRSGDGGVTWKPIADDQIWPSGSQYGMVAESDDSLLVWFTNAADVTTYLRSVDHGETFQPATAPADGSGAIVQISNGFVTLGTQAALSRDGRTWVAAYVPYVS